MPTAPPCVVLAQPVKIIIAAKDIKRANFFIFSPWNFAAILAKFD
jgi:hypothetical protein